MRYNMLISELTGVGKQIFVAFEQSQASCFPLFKVFMLS